MILRRTQHTTDIKLAGRLARRTIKNWINYKTPIGLWLPTDHAVETVQSIPDDWEGPDFHFTKHVARGPMQLYFGDTADPNNTTMIGARLSHAPGKWLQVQAQDVIPGVPMQVVVNEKQVRWIDLWPKSTLVYQAIPSGFRKYIHMRQGHPDSFRFTVRIPAGGSIRQAGGGAEILDSQGQICLRIPAPWGMDSSAGDPLDGGGQSVRVTMEWGASFTEPSGSHVTVLRLVPNQDDLDSAAYPVLFDPTVQITGTTGIEDNYLWAPPNENTNYGGQTLYFGGSNNSLHPLLRIFGADVPAGTITGFRLFHYCTLIQSPVVLDAFFIKDGNTWVEGTGSGVEIGASCWAYAKYNTQQWLGSFGCNTSGTDYDADASPPSQTITTTGWGTFTLNPAWPPLWRDGARVENGIVLKPPDLVFRQARFRSTEAASLNNYFEIDYEPPPTGGIAQRYFFMGGS